MNDSRHSKVVIIGAGHVGMHCACCLMLQRRVDELVLIDSSAEKATAQALDLDDMASNLDQRFTVRAGTYEDCCDAQIVIIAAGKSRRPGQTRLDMFDESLTVMERISGPLADSCFDGVLISVSNPADIIGDYFRRRLGLPRERAFSTGTSLDSARLRRVLSDQLGVDRRFIQAFCMGEHGDASFVPKSHVFIGGIPIAEYLQLHPELAGKIDFDHVVEQVRRTGSEIVGGKGCTEFGIGAVVSNLVAAILHDEKCILPLSVLLEGEYGISGVPAGVPCIVGKNGIEEILEISLSPKERKELEASCEVIGSYIARVSSVLDPLDE